MLPSINIIYYQSELAEGLAKLSCNISANAYLSAAKRKAVAKTKAQKKKEEHNRRGGEPVGEGVTTLSERAGEVPSGKAQKEERKTTSCGSKKVYVALQGH